MCLVETHLQLLFVVPWIDRSIYRLQTARTEAELGVEREPRAWM